jgi:hypothetical protein
MTYQYQTSNSFLVVKPLDKHAALVAEYNLLIKKLKDKSINIIEFPRIENIESTQYLFSNHWISFHGNGVTAVYPMSTLSRQQERSDLVFDVLQENNFDINDVIDFTRAEEEGIFLEGLGSVVLDRENNVAYASISKLCDEELFVEFCEELEFTPIVFNSMFSDTSEVAHTSSILSISKDFVMVASGLIQDKKQRKLVALQLKKTGRELIYISEAQVLNHVADIKQIENSKGNSIIVLSNTVLENLTVVQISTLEKYGAFLVVDYNQTESFGGRSVGAILNEIF